VSESEDRLKAEMLRLLLSYDPETGVFRWLVNRGCVLAGSVAGMPTSKDGYLRIGVNKRRYLAHRLAHLWMTGEWPSKIVDHEDLNKSNNCWSNIRAATHSQNNANRQHQANNKIGVKGVSAAGYRFRAAIVRNRKQQHLGTFDTVELAAAAYLKAANENFGKFARAG
jgi:hypothetical protein